MRIEILKSGYEKKYEDFLLKSSLTLFYASNKYRKFLKEFLQDDDHYFIALDNHDEIIGALPAFLKKNKEYGNVLNSLPFYGSNGGIIEFEGNMETRKQLLQEFNKFSVENKCVSSTIITSPFETDNSFYEKNYSHLFKDERIGQITNLPPFTENLDEDLMEIFHYKTRNMVRKGQKGSFTISTEFNKDIIDFLSDTHEENMVSIGGTGKPKDFFILIPAYFEYGKDFKIFTAFKNNVPVAALLLFYFNKTVEYFTPVIKSEYRNEQPLSYIIYEAMKDAALSGYDRWNWGGTWLSQDGVYQFKSKWGTKDHPYYYYTSIANHDILNCSRQQLLKEYPFFYVVPFNALKA